MSHSQTITPETAKKWLSTQEAILIDVREPMEFRSESIPNAMNMPLQTLDASHLTSNIHKDKKVIFQCLSGNRSQQACDRLKAADLIGSFYTLEGGLSAWKKAGFPTQKSKNCTICFPIDRQVHILLGLLIIIGVVTGIYHPYGYGIPLFIGLGLLNAGLTGWCGMARLMSKMPWNQP